MKSIKGQPFFCSWSGGKDSCLALYRAIQSEGIPKALLTMFTEDGARSRSHGLPIGVIQQQAQALRIPLIVRNASWDKYEESFLSALRDFKQREIGWGVFGDIDLEPHLEWVERVCSSVAVEAYEPLWKKPRRDLLEELLRLGFTATIVAVKQDALDIGFLGRTLNRQVILEMEEVGIDASGEEGEYHTVVTSGPLMSSPIRIEIAGQVMRNGYCFLDIKAMS
jgi:uncharacterized protein (TIGR00290 family)